MKWFVVIMKSMFEYHIILIMKSEIIFNSQIRWRKSFVVIETWNVHYHDPYLSKSKEKNIEVL